MMSVTGFKTKKELKARAVGQVAAFVVVETSMSGSELRENGKFAVVGPSPYERKWYAQIEVKEGVITKVT